jgi:hypothetical protein
MSLFDHVIGASDKRRRHGDTECLGGLEVDDQLEFGRLHHRQVGWHGAFENPTSVVADLPICIGNAGTITHQAAGCDELAQIVDGGQRMMCGQCDQSVAVACEERIARDKNPTDLMLDKGCEGRIDIAFASGVHNMNLLPKGAPRRLCIFRLGNRSRA